MTFDLSFRGLSFPQARALMAAAEQFGVQVDAQGAVDVARALTVTPVGPSGPAKEAAPASPGPSASSSVAPSPAAGEREPGSDDGPPMSETELGYFRAPTVKAVVKMVIEAEKISDYDAVLARCLALRARGIAALEAIPEEVLGDRVAGCLAALGF